MAVKYIRQASEYLRKFEDSCFSGDPFWQHHGPHLKQANPLPYDNLLSELENIRDSPTKLALGMGFSVCCELKGRNRKPDSRILMFFGCLRFFDAFGEKKQKRWRVAHFLLMLLEKNELKQREGWDVMLVTSQISHICFQTARKQSAPTKVRRSPRTSRIRPWHCESPKCPRREAKSVLHTSSSPHLYLVLVKAAWLRWRRCLQLGCEPNVHHDYIATHPKISAGRPSKHLHDQLVMLIFHDFDYYSWPMLVLLSIHPHSPTRSLGHSNPQFKPLNLGMKGVIFKHLRKRWQQERKKRKLILHAAKKKTSVSPIPKTPTPSRKKTTKLHVHLTDSGIQSSAWPYSPKSVRSSGRPHDGSTPGAHGRWQLQARLRWPPHRGSLAKPYGSILSSCAKAFRNLGEVPKICVLQLKMAEFFEAQRVLLVVTRRIGFFLEMT